MNKMLIGLMGAFSSALNGQSTWELPATHLRYHEVCFLTSHNSYAATHHGYYYAQQTLTIKEQLAMGVRALMLDTHEDRLQNVVLCHRNHLITRIICRGKAPMPLTEALKTIREFLIENPTEIITIFLENYVRNAEILDNSFRSADLEQYILRPSDWDPTDDGWPAIGWMQQKNKRLVIFNSIEKTSLTFHQWLQVVENQWGALHPRAACKERWESKKFRSSKRYLYLVNYFPTLKLKFDKPYVHINSKGLDRCMARIRSGLDEGYCTDRLPNFISIDFVDEGNGIKHVLDVNKHALLDEQRKNLFRAIRG